MKIKNIVGLSFGFSGFIILGYSVVNHIVACPDTTNARYLLENWRLILFGFLCVISSLCLMDNNK